MTRSTVVTAINTWASTRAEEDAMNDDHAPLWRQMIELASADGYRGGSVLDYGCNQGGFLKMLYDAAPFARAVGSDIAADSLDVARRRLAGLPADFCHPDDLAAMQGRFDTAFSHEVLYLLPDLAAHAALIAHVLKPGGTYFAAIGCHTDQPLWADWKGLISSYSNVPVQDYSLNDYAEAFFAAGFTAAVQPYRTRGFFPLKRRNPYFPSVADTLRYYDTDKVLFRFANANNLKG